MRGGRRSVGREAGPLLLRVRGSGGAVSGGAATGVEAEIRAAPPCAAAPKWSRASAPPSVDVDRPIEAAVRHGLVGCMACTCGPEDRWHRRVERRTRCCSRACATLRDAALLEAPRLLAMGGTWGRVAARALPCVMSASTVYARRGRRRGCCQLQARISVAASPCPWQDPAGKSWRGTLSLFFRSHAARSPLGSTARCVVRVIEVISLRVCGWTRRGATGARAAGARRRTRERAQAKKTGDAARRPGRPQRAPPGAAVGHGGSNL